MFTVAYHVQNAFLRVVGNVKYQLLERRFKYTLHVSLVVITLLLAVASAALTSTHSEIFGLAIVGAVAGLAFLVILYHYMVAGIILIVLTSTIVNPTLPRDMTLTLLLVITLVVLWLVKLLIADRSFRSVIPAYANKPTVFFAIAVVISFLWSSIYVDPIVGSFQQTKLLPRLTTGLVMVISPVLMLLVANFVKSVKLIQGIIWYFIGFASVLVIPFILQRGTPSFINIGGQFAAWGACFALGQLLFNTNLNRKQQAFLLFVVGGWTYALIGVYFSWLSGWVTLMVGLSIVMLLRSRWILVPMVIAGLIFVATNTDFLQSMFDTEASNSGDTRLAASATILDIVNNDHFLFGTGPTGYYFYLIVMTHGSNLLQLSHNNYVDIYAQTGIVGFTIWIILWVGIGLSVWKTFRLTPRLGVERSLAASFVGCFCISVVAMMLGDWVTPFTYTQTVRGFAYTAQHWLWVGMALALGNILRSRQESVNHLANEA